MSMPINRQYQRAICALCGADEMTASGIVYQSTEDGSWTDLRGVTDDMLVCGACGEENDGVEYTAFAEIPEPAEPAELAEPTWASASVDVTRFSMVAFATTMFAMPSLVARAAIASGIFHLPGFSTEFADVAVMGVGGIGSLVALAFVVDMLARYRCDDRRQPIILPIGQIAHYTLQKIRGIRNARKS